MNNGKGMGGRCIIGVAGWRNHPGQLRQSVRPALDSAIENDNRRPGRRLICGNNSAETTSGFAAVSDRIDKGHEGRGGMAAVGIVEMKTFKGRAPVSQHFNQRAVFDVRFGHRFRHIGQTNAIQRAIQHVYDAIRKQRSVYPDIQFASRFFKLPGALLNK